MFRKLAGFAIAMILAANPAMLAWGQSRSDTQPASQATSQPKEGKPKTAPKYPLPPGVTVQRDIEYSRAGDKPLLMDIYRPEKAEGPLPVLVWIHGGSWKSGNKEACVAALLAPRGYAAVSINYRLSQEAIWPAQIQDCRAAIRFLRAHAREYDLDADHIGAWGASAGGQLAALLGTGCGENDPGEVGENLQHSSRVQAVCDSFGPMTFLPPYMADSAPASAPASVPSGKKKRSNPVEQLFGGPVLANRDKAVQASPLLHVSSSTPPFLIVHGDADPLVPIRQSELIHDALRKAGVEATFHVVKGGRHGGLEFLSPAVMDIVDNFFAKHLKPGQAAKP